MNTSVNISPIREHEDISNLLLANKVTYYLLKLIVSADYWLTEGCNVPLLRQPIHLLF